MGQLSKWNFSVASTIMPLTESSNKISVSSRMSSLPINVAIAIYAERDFTWAEKFLLKSPVWVGVV